VKSPRPTAVPKHMQAIYGAVVALTDAFCRDHLTDEYRDLARAMAASTLTQAPKPPGLGAAAHLGLRHHPRIGPTQLPVRQGIPASHDHGRGLHSVRRRPKHGQRQG
jgi:hypothetical protein